MEPNVIDPRGVGHRMGFGGGHVAEPAHMGDWSYLGDKTHLYGGKNAKLCRSKGIFGVGQYSKCFGRRNSLPLKSNKEVSD